MKIYIAGSYSGSTSLSESENLGSTPSPAAISPRPSSISMVCADAISGDFALSAKLLNFLVEVRTFFAENPTN